MNSLKGSRAASLVLALLMFVSLVPFTGVRAEEGMFLPDAIAQLPLQKRGLKIKPQEIYDPAGVSLKDAVVIVDGGTGEFVSPEGLFLTNHHVAFDALVEASSLDKNYGEAGFAAKSRAEELPAQGYAVTITQEIKDVTGEVLAGVAPDASVADRARAVQVKTRSMETAGTNEAEGVRVRVLPLNEGLSYYKFTYLILRDVRVVYAPPKDIGDYGGEEDNFEWPRHCGDFTFMRAYVSPEGKSAAYSPNNVPYKPKKFLTLSLDGVKEGDFMMVLGYPGTTRRYRESYSVEYTQDVTLPFQADIWSNEVAIMERAGQRDPALRVKLQSDIANINNGLKNYVGSIQALRRAGLVEKKRAQEAAYTIWINQDAARKAKYGEALPGLEKAYQEYRKTSLHDTLLGQIFGVNDLFGIIFFAQQIAADKEKPEAERNPALSPMAVQQARSRIAQTLSERTPSVEREALAFMLRKADELPADQKIAAIEKRFGSLQGEARRRAEEDFAREIIESKRFATAAELSGLFDLSSSQLREIREPLVEFATELGAELQQAQRRTQSFNAATARWRPLLIQGMAEMRGTKSYPDANRTLRFTYGEVKGYVPREALVSTPFTTLTGVMEKETGRAPFIVPEKLKQLYRAKDFGAYALPGGRDVAVDFLSTVDSIGGNSGSPVMNARGEQVGILFDGNYEGLGNDFFYNTERYRAIAIDIRYVLFLTDKFGGAGWILNELNIKGKSKK
ncbi:MAG: S46 family peptidase [Acidobacteria bacterium]|nr:S46 family peptidase [Acidobacteriota bacterium]